MKTLLIALLFFPLVPSAFYKPAKFCRPPNPDTPNVEGCLCLVQHAKSEFCTDPKAPLPSCCWATEKKRGLQGCSCCRAVYGTKRDILLSEVGSYFHHRDMEMGEVEYEIGQ